MTTPQLQTLAGECRDFLVRSVSQTGGHLGPNLGVVELTIALHRVFDSPHDSIVFDTGHISYVHKLLTGRQDFARLRHRDGLSGYPCRAESPHDVVENSHASTSLSWAEGIAKGRRLRGETDRRTVAVIGDGAVGLLAVLAAKELGAERIIAMSRHADRQKLALEFGATDIVTERGDEGVARIKELTGGLGAHSVIEAVGTQESMMQAIHATRAGGHVGYVGVSHDVTLPGQELFFSGVHLHGGPAPVRQYLPHLIDLIWNRQINPGKVFDLTLPLDQAADGYQAMDNRTAIKVLLQP